MNKVYILRGIPGSGKSTYAKTIPNAVVCSADDFFVRNGEYIFDASLLFDAHGLCRRKFMEALVNRTPVVVLDNTNVHQWEVTPYILMAEAFPEYSVEVVEFHTEPEVCISRNVHNCPADVIKRMHDNFEPVKGMHKKYVRKG